MLVPAQLYKEELKRKLVECWYRPEYDYYFMGDHHEFTVPDNTDWREDFVSVNDKGEVVGYFSYNHDKAARSLTNFGLIAFTGSKMERGRFVRECVTHIENLVDLGLRRLDFWAVADNPVNHLYRKLIWLYNGREIGRLIECSYFGGKYHDSILYEVLF